MLSLPSASEMHPKVNLAINIDSKQLYQVLAQTSLVSLCMNF